jgi:FkbM family methyltransferase
MSVRVDKGLDLSDHFDLSRLTSLTKEVFAVRRIGGGLCCARFILSILFNARKILQRRSLGPADEGMKGRNYALQAFGHPIKVDGASFGGAREVYGRNVYFPLSGFSLRPDDVVIDLGANAGLFTTLAALMAKKVVAVEAQYGFIDRIHSTLLLNNCADKVSVEFGLVGPGSGLLDQQGFASPEFTRTPPVVRMSELIARHELDTVNFLKIDIEGSEFDLFSNDNDWLRQVDRLAMEVHCDFGEVHDLVETLEGKGFEVWLMDNQQHVVDAIDDESGYILAKRREVAHVAVTEGNPA